MMSKEYYDSRQCPKQQFHVHEVQGSTFIDGRIPHNHRFATVTGEAIQTRCGDHVHEVYFRTDYAVGHYHEFCGKTLGAICIGDSHVHFLEAKTTVDADHRHEFKFATLIDDPTGC